MGASILFPQQQVKSQSSVPAWWSEFSSKLDLFLKLKGEGVDPFSCIYKNRRKDFSLFSQQLSDHQIESFREYLFGYRKDVLEQKPVRVLNFIAGSWRSAKEQVLLKSLADDRRNMAEVPNSNHEDVHLALNDASDYWRSLAWSEETLAYRKQVIKNFSKILNYFYEECLEEIRLQIPKTRLEADKDFWEAKRAADHLEGTSERALTGMLLPSMIEQVSFWKDSSLPAGIAAIFCPMNFIYGISVIHLVGCYLSGSPLIFKGHPWAAITNTTLIKMLLASGADPRVVQKIEGFGKGVESLVSDSRVAVVSVTGSDATAERMQSLRGVRPVRFEGGGCNWAYVDDGFSDEELKRVAIRLTYSKLGFSSHKCTTLHGVAASSKTSEKLLYFMKQEMESWSIEDPSKTEATKVIGPCMVHKPSTLESIQEAAEKAGAKIYKRGGRVRGNDYFDHTTAVDPVIIAGIHPDFCVNVDWDGKEKKNICLATTEFFMPILVQMDCSSLDEFLKFCLLKNPHDLAVSLWTKKDSSLLRARKVLGGMLKENDGTDSALEWEEFGASGVGTSGNMGVGEPEATFAIYTRRQKGRHLVF